MAPRLHPAPAPLSEPEIGVAILGAGFAGLCMAIKLKEQGREDFRIFEKASSLGGTWRDNTYPGCACDVPSHLYSYSFDQNPDWSRTYATQPEILAYLRRVAAKHDIDRRISFDTPIKAIVWDESTRRWHLSARDGRRFTARVVVSAVGALHVPKLPDLPGLGSFEGPVFHSAQWRHDLDLTGKRVAVIGTGASAIQFIPEIAPVVGRLTVFQRSPPWVLPRHDKRMSATMRTLLARLPGLLRVWRAVQYWRAEIVALGLAYKPKLMGRGQKRSARFKEREIENPALRLKLNPFYTMGCKRVLLSDDFYATMNRPNVDLVTRAIREVRPRSIVTANGREHPCDVIIHATGFAAFNPTAGVAIHGRDGRLLADDWRDGPEAFRGVAVAGYPNYFMLMGPNSGLGHNSIVFMIEAQVRYVMQCLGWIESGRLDPVEVRSEVQRAYNDQLRKRFTRTVWQDRPGSAWQLPCTSWYVDARGRNTALWPGLSVGYWMAMLRSDIADYRPAAGATAEPAERAATSAA
ncbi:MAG: NAD(P)/FAD-dependent oxidoreductase [Planctomycetia bacterium]|nr:NAD(P)/FAD-dependent oxidoreductase [Planctomycetia bacterium]